jgi:glycosyltransferase involved in cell wall biosynthesis
MSSIELSIIMPCLNEAETIAVCIQKAQRFLEQSGIAGEVVIGDNGSTDGSQQIATSLGARVVAVPHRGYGNALMGAITGSRGTYVIMGDADDSYDFSRLQPFVDQLRAGHDLVMGNRFLGGIAPGAMPPLHKYLGNPVLTAIGRLFFGGPARDFHCGLRGFNRESILKLDLRTTGMEFASEMVVKARIARLRVIEVPTTLSPDGRSRPPHLRSWRDGWRHLRFLLLYAPRWLFLLPGVLLMLLGTAVALWLLPGPRNVFGLALDVHTILYAGMAVLIGFQAVCFWFFSKVFAISEGLLPPDPRLDRMFRYVTLETGLIVGVLMVAGGLGGSVYAVYMWEQRAFGPLEPSQMLRTILPAAAALTLGSQIIFASFFLSVLGLRRR